VRIFVGTANKFLSAAFIRELKTYFEDTWLQEHVWNARPHIEGRLIPIMDKSGRKRRSAIAEEGTDDTEAEDKKVVWRGDALQVLRSDILKEPTVTVGSVGSVATGFHYDELYLDDVVTFDNVSSPEKNKRVFSWIYDLESVLDPEYFDDELYISLKRCVKAKTHEEKLKRICTVGNVIMVVGTRYDKLDYYAHIMEHYEDLEFDVYQKNIYKNGVDKDGGYLWEERFSEKQEKRLRANMTARRFASQYLNNILAEEDKVLRYENIQWLHPSSINQDSEVRGYAFIRRKEDEKARRIKLVCVIDPAAATNASADYTAMAIGGVDHDGNLYILDLKLGRWQIHQWVKEMYSLLDKWKIDVVHVETVAFQKTLIQTIRGFFKEYRPIAVVEYKPGNVKKETRIEQTLQPIFESFMIFMSTYLGGNTNLQDQITYFPRKTMKDDGVDVISMVKEIAKPPAKPKDGKARSMTGRTRWNKRFGGIW
jgi:predicted phage terminase large subunit-like protein